MSSWTFLTNHARVLLCIAQDADIRLRDIAERVGITERAAQRIVGDLVAEGYVTTAREGRRNHYEVHFDRKLRHPLECGADVGGLVQVLHGAP